MYVMMCATRREKTFEVIANSHRKVLPDLIRDIGRLGQVHAKCEPNGDESEAS